MATPYCKVTPTSSSYAINARITLSTAGLSYPQGYANSVYQLSAGTQILGTLYYYINTTPNISGSPILIKTFTSVNLSVAQQAIQTIYANGAGNEMYVPNGLYTGTYYLVAYWVTDNGNAIDSYPLSISGLTIPTVPTLAATTSATSITQTTASTGGNVTSDGNATITERGVCYSLSTTPTISNTKVIVSGTTGSFTANLTGLAPGATYYVRAYATNSVGTAYGTQVNFTTLNVPAVPTSATTENATNITSTGATLNGTVTTGNESSQSFLFCGFEYGLTNTYGNATSANPYAIANGELTPRNVNSVITGITNSLTYHYRTKLTDNNGITVYGLDKTFTASDPGVSSIATRLASNVGSESATLNGTFINTTGTGLITVGFYIDLALNGNYTFFPVNSYGSGIYDYSITIYGLLPNTTYSYYAMGRNTSSGGASYFGVGVNFVTTTPVTNVFKPRVFFV